MSSYSVSRNLADIMPALNRAIDQAFTNYSPVASPAVNAAIAGDLATINQIRAKYQIVATVIPPQGGKHYRLKVECFNGGQLYDYSWRYRLTEAQAQAYAASINGSQRNGA